jgi:gluconokinase
MKAPRQPAKVLVVMGVSGAGKTTIGALLAGRLGWEFADGDWFHPPANVRKMQSGEALSDDDRWPWLEAIAAWVDAKRRLDERAVIACSVLKRSYRDVVIGPRADVRLVFLDGDRALIARRLAARRGHFMPPTLLDSQFSTLEAPAADEDAIVVSIAPRPHEIVNDIIDQLAPPAGPAPADDARKTGGRLEETPR